MLVATTFAMASFPKKYSPFCLSITVRCPCCVNITISDSQISLCSSENDDIDAAQSDGQVPPALLTTTEKLGHREKPAGFH